ncbi:MAG: hypothetical protein HYY04_11310 [Chloroflexi bacterium]|nr:hypothetical protein [Chloroflexota bacterium]
MPNTTAPITLRSTFENPPAAYRPTPAWWWGAERVTPERVEWELQRFHEGGIPALVIFSLAPDAPYQGSPADDPAWFSDEWWDVVAHACAVAERLGMQLWFYDRIGFGQSRLIRELVDANPPFAARMLERARSAEALPAGAEALATIDDHVYFHRPGPPTGAHLGIERCDICQPAAAAALLDVTHGQWERRLGRYLGSVIAGSFQDELRPLATWTPGLPAAFRRRTGADLLAHLPDLFDTRPAGTAARVAYRRAMAELAEEAFFKPLHDWHVRHGMLVSCDQIQRARHGDPLVGQLAYHDYPRTHRWFLAPGNDHNGETRVHSSLAHLYGRPRVWFEAFHSSGWGGTLEETFHWLLPWLQQGVTLYHPHSVYYSTKGSWWEWAPPSTCWRQPYWQHYPLFAQTVARLCATLSQGAHRCDVALVYPSSAIQADLPLSGPAPESYETTRAFWELAGNVSWRNQGLAYRDDRRDGTGAIEKAGQDFDVIDEDSLLAGEVRDGHLQVAGERFRALIFPRTRYVPLGALQQARRLVQAGGLALFVGALPEQAADGEGQDAEIAALMAELLPIECRSGDAVWQFRGPGGGLAAFVATAHQVTAFLHEHLAPPVVGDVRALHRQVDGRDLYLIVPRATFPPPEERENRFVRYRDPASFGRLVVAGQPVKLDPVDLVPTGRVEEWPTVPERMTVTVCQTGPVEQWDPYDGSVRSARVVARDAETTTVELDLSRSPAAILVFGGEPSPERDADSQSQISEAIDLGLTWQCELLPTTDNRYGDLDWPPYPGPLSVEIRRLEYQESTSDRPPASPWGSALCSFAPFLETSGPYPAGTTREQVLARADEGAWRPCWYSPRYGIEKDPFHWSYLGPKGYVPEEFIHLGRVPAGESCAVRTAAVNQTGAVMTALLRVRTSGLAAAWANGEPVGEGRGELVAPVTLEAGANELRLVVTSEGAPHLRGFFHFLPADAIEPYGHPLPEGNWLTPEVPVRPVPGLVLDPHPEAGTRVAWYRCLVPPGAERVYVSIRGAASAVLDGEPLDLVDGTAHLPHPQRPERALAFRVEMPVGTLAGAAFARPVRFDCGPGAIRLGDWRDQGLPHYVGGIRYRRTFDGLPNSGAVVLDLGRVRGTAEVSVNGQPCGVRLWHPYRFDITAALHDGGTALTPSPSPTGRGGSESGRENELEITVFNTLGPHFGDGHPSPYCYTGQDRSGLFGPVRLLCRP